MILSSHLIPSDQNTFRPRETDAVYGLNRYSPSREQVGLTHFFFPVFIASPSLSRTLLLSLLRALTPFPLGSEASSFPSSVSGCGPRPRPCPRLSRAPRSPPLRVCPPPLGPLRGITRSRGCGFRDASFAALPSRWGPSPALLLLRDVEAVAKRP